MLWDEYIWDLKLTESNFWVAAFAILVMFFYDYQFGEKQKDKDKTNFMRRISNIPQHSMWREDRQPQGPRSKDQGPHADDISRQ